MNRKLTLDFLPKENVYKHFQTSSRTEYDWIKIYEDSKGIEISYIIDITPEFREGKSLTSQRLEIKDVSDTYRMFEIDYPSDHLTVKDLTEEEHIDFIITGLGKLDV